MNAGQLQYMAELAMSSLVSKQLHNTVGHCYETCKFRTVVHFLVYFTIPVHFPVQHRGITPLLYFA